MKLPKFLLAHKNSDNNNRVFVVHCEHPRFIEEICPGGVEGEFMLFDISGDPDRLIEAKKMARVFFEGAD